MKEIYWWGELVGYVDAEGKPVIDREAHPQAWCASHYSNALGFAIRDRDEVVNGQFVRLTKSDDATMREVL